jgi:hypothetical protein
MDFMFFKKLAQVDHSLPTLAEKLSRIGDWGGLVLDAIQHKVDFS